MPSAFGELYGSVRSLFPLMLVVATLAVGRIIWWRFVSAPILVSRPLWALFATPPDQASLGKPEAARRPWLWFAPEEAAHRPQRLVTSLFAVMLVLGALGVLLGNLDSDSVEPPAARVLLYNLWGTFFLGMGAMALADIAAAGCAFFVAVRGGGGGVRDFHTRWQPVVSSRQRAAAVGAMWLLFTLLGLRSGYYWGSATPALRSLEIPMAGLPACLDGYRVGMISDIHAGPLVGRAEVQRLADWAAGASLDVLLLDGDFADGRPDLVGALVEPIAELSTAEDGRRPPDGLWFVTGNHEYLHGGSGVAWMQWWSAHGVRVLYNNNTALPARPNNTRGCAAGEAWTLAGVPDFWMDTPNLDEALAGVAPGSPVLLMAHQPKQAVDAALTGQVQLQVSGHTHGGQTWPMTPGVYVANTYLAGMHERDGMHVYVSEGAVGWGERVRFWTTPELTLFTLRSGGGEPSGDVGLHASVLGAWLGLLIFPLYFLLWTVVCCSGKRWRTARPSVAEGDARALLAVAPASEV